MLGYIFLAILTGIVIGTSRAINARLSVATGPFKASFWNHIVGFIFITFVILIVGEVTFDTTTDVPIFTYLAGFFGALFVAVNSYVFTRIGAIKTVLLVISGQMISSVLLDYQKGTILSTGAQFFGVAIILAGVYLSKSSSIRGQNR
ncbi:MAG: DMT family transporter [Taibaiella sp.]|jgi:transporter family-2 protein